MGLLNNTLDIDYIKINYVNKKYMIIISVGFIMILVLALINKDYYYENSLIKGNDNIILLADKKVINRFHDNKSIIINGIESRYSINGIIDEKDICYVSINLITSIENIKNMKYKIFLGKETILEYIIRIIRKI